MPRSIAEYLQQPHRVAMSAARPGRVVSLGGDRYQLSVRPLAFAHLRFQPVVDLRVWADEAEVVRLKSTRCDLQGIELGDGFSLELFGQLRSVSGPGGDRLKGMVDLGVRVDLPPPLDRIPAAAMQSAGQLLLVQVLARMKHRLVERLRADYRAWATEPHDRPPTELNSSRCEAS
ncbi:MAG: DUF1997 domain-containing protein [Oscillatoriales cyanobacterium]|nr:MAG: DUF1997 domain-containing protein [Oscillatoriales cyanobacterium]